MGGKSKSSQRTKNNVRPSSSGRSAGLLFPVGPVPVASAGGLSLFSSLACEPPLPPSLALSFKKLTKKDPITKVKALQELSQLVSIPEHAADARAALPAWSSHYRSLANDSDGRVREHAQLCHYALMSSCGRAVGPLLPAVLPAWLLSCHDAHPNAARTAAAALLHTFPDRRLTFAIRHCKDNILALLTDLLTKPLDIDKIKSPEEEEEAAVFASRAVSALGALQQVVECTASKDQQWMQPTVDTLVGDTNYWRLGRHRETRVRCAWYSCMERMCGAGLMGSVGPKVDEIGPKVDETGPKVDETGPKVDDKGLKVNEKVLKPDDARPKLDNAGPKPRGVGPKLCRTLLAAKESGHCDGVRWRAMAALMRNHSDWSSWTDLALLETRLLGLLECGGWGDARALRAMLWDLLALLPPEVATARFYTRLFDALFTGLQTKRVMASKSERSAYCGMLGECLCWGLRGEAAQAQVQAQVERWLRAAVERPVLVKPSAVALRSLCLQWLQHQHEHPSAEVGAALSALWLALAAAPLIDDHDHVAQQPVEDAVQAHTLLLTTMCTTTTSPNERSGVTFEDDDGHGAEAPAGERTEAGEQSGDAATPACVTRQYDERLTDAVVGAAALWLEYGRAHGSVDRLGAEVAGAIGAAGALRGESGSWGAVAARLGLEGPAALCRRGTEWLRDGRGGAAVVAAALRECSEEERIALYEEFEQLEEKAVWALVCASIATGLSWRGGSMEARCARTAAIRAAEGDQEARRSVIAALTDSTVSAETLEAIGEALGRRLSALREDDEGQPEGVLSLLGALAEAARAHGPHRMTSLCLALAAYILQLRPDGNGDGNDVSSSVQSDVILWCHWMVRSLDPTSVDMDTLITELRQLIQQHIHHDYGDSGNGNDSDSGEVCMWRVSNAATVAAIVASSAHAGNGLDALTSDHVTADSLCHVCVCSCALTGDILAGTLHCPVDDSPPLQRVVQRSDDDSPPEVSRDTLLTYLRGVLFGAVALRTLLTGGAWDDRGADDERHATTDAGEVTLESDDGPDGSPADDESTGRRDGDEAAEERLVGDEPKETHRDVRPGESDAQHDVNESSHDPSVEPPERDEAAVGVTTFGEDEDGDGDEDVRFRWLDEAPPWWDARRMADRVADVLYHRAVLDALERNYSYWEHYGLVSSVCSKVSSAMSVVMRRIDADTRHELDELLRERAATLAHYWAVAAVTAGAMEAGAQSSGTGSGYFHTVQARSQLLPARSVDRLPPLWEAACRALLAALPPDCPDRALVTPAMVGHAGADGDEEARTDLLLAIYYSNPRVFHIDTCVVIPSWASAQCACALSQYLTQLVRTVGWSLPAHHWDLCALAAAALLAQAHRARAHLHNIKVSLVTTWTLRLIGEVSSFVSSVGERCLVEQPLAHVAALPREWSEVFEPHIRPHIYDLLMHLLLQYKGESVPCTVVSVAAAMVSVLPLVTAEGGTDGRQTLRQAAVDVLAAGADGSDGSGGSDGSNGSGGSDGSNGSGGSTAMQLLAFRVLCACADSARADDERALQEWSQSAETELSPPPSLSPVPLARAALAVVNAPRPLPVLLLAEALYRLTTSTSTTSASDECSDHYYHIYKEFDFVQPLVSRALLNLPPAVAKHAHGTAAPPNDAAPMFLDEPALDVTDTMSSSRVAALWCRALHTSTAGLGAARARALWGAADARERRALSRLVSAVMAPHTVRAALADVARRCADLPCEDLRVLRSTGELVLTLEVEERHVELRLELSPLHGLVPPKLRGEGLAAPPPNLSRRALRCGPGGLAPLLRRWAKCVQARVEGKPPCYICYCRLHPGSQRLPALPCKQCKNKFHAECIRKWFATSRKANCPLCRGVF